MSAIFLGPLSTQHAELFAALQRWVGAGWLRELDRSLAAFFSRLAPDADSLLILGAALASHQLGRGHTCLDLQAALLDANRALALPPEGESQKNDSEAELPPAPPSELLAGISLVRWTQALDAAPALVGDGVGATPLVRIGHRLYLRRYWQYEQSVRAEVARRVAEPTSAALPAAQAQLDYTLNRLFPKKEEDTANWQKIACALAARQAFCIITGGPGTGKTTTVVRLLALLQQIALADNSKGGQRLRIGLAAPTGKAAARLSESIAGAVADLPLAGLAADETALRAAIPTTVSTVHRLLGSRPGTRHFRHDARNPLPLDVLVLDEASMLDLEMMACVLAALRPQARLILLGDKDQLASVEAGAVLGDLCQRADTGHYDAPTADWLEAVTGEPIDAALRDVHGRPLDQAVVKLRKSWRFGAGSGIGRLADAVNSGDAAQVARVLAQGYPDLSAQLVSPQNAALRRLVVDGAPEDFSNKGQGRIDGGKKVPPPTGYGHYLRLMRARQPELEAPQEAQDAWAREVLAALGQFQLLCALRSGPQGVANLNPRIANLLRAEGLLEEEQGGWYAGRPVLVTRNDYALGLMNGDVGVALPVPFAAVPREAAGVQRRLRVAFAAADLPGGIRWVLPSRLRAVETVFAMTVHKSQGSEFSHAAFLLPERMSPVLTRELVYTGITRARHWFTLAAPQEVLLAAAQRRVERVGGLSAP